MKLFGHTQQTTRLTKAERLSNRIKALEEFHDARQALEAYNDAVSAISLLKQLETHSGNNSEIINLAYESINDQLGYPEGSRLTSEGIFSAVGDFAKNIWGKLTSAWKASSKWVVDLSYDIFTKEGSGQQADMIRFIHKLLKKCIVDRARPYRSDTTYNEDLTAMEIMKMATDFINGDSNLTNRDELHALVKEINEASVTTNDPMPSNTDNLYSFNKRDAPNISKLLSTLAGNKKPVLFRTIRSDFKLVGRDVTRSPSSLKPTSNTWRFMERSFDESKEIFRLAEECKQVCDMLVSVVENTELLNPLVEEMTNDILQYEKLYEHVSGTIDKIQALGSVFSSAIGNDNRNL